MKPTNSAIIIDNGSGFIKAGFEGEDIPRIEFPCIVGAPKHQGIVVGMSPRRAPVGGDVRAKLGILAIKYPISRGLITNWDYMESVWHHTFYNELRVYTEEHPIILTEAPLNPKANRERITKIMFETFGVTSLCLKSQAALALYAAGKSTGVVLDSGFGITQCVAFYEGNPIIHSIQKVKIAGNEFYLFYFAIGSDLTSFLMKKLTERGYSFTSSADREIVRDLKEKLSFVAYDFDAEMTASEISSEVERSFELPNGDIIVIGNERFRSPEILFQPEFYRCDAFSIQHIVFCGIFKCEFSIRSELFANIVLSGGTTMIEGMEERLAKEIKEMAPRGMEVKVLSPPSRKYSAWIGASLLASSNNFTTMCISKEEYDETGPTIVHQKCI